MQLADLWRSSPLLWSMGVIVLTPVIVIVGVLAVGVAVAGAVWRTVAGSTTVAEADAAPAAQHRHAVVVELDATAVANLCATSAEPALIRAA